MAFQTRRVITSVEDLPGPKASHPPHRYRPAARPVAASRSHIPSSRPRSVSPSSSSAKSPVRGTGTADMRPGPSKTRPVSKQADPSARAFSSVQNHKTLPLEQTHTAAHEYDQFVSARHDLDLVPLSVGNVEGSDGTLLKDVTKDELEKVDQTETLERVVENETEKADQKQNLERLSSDSKPATTEFSSKRGSGNTESYYNGQSDSDDDQNVHGKGAAGVKWSRQQRLNEEQRLRSMASYAKSQGIDLMKQIQEQKRCQAEQEQQPVYLAKLEMEEMKRLLQEQRRSSYEDIVPTETEMDSSSERHKSMKDWKLVQKDSFNSEIDPVNLVKVENPMQVLDWLRAMDDDTNHRINVSENRTLSLLQAIKDGNMDVVKEYSPGFHDELVSMERSKKKEKQSHFAEEQIQEYEGLLNAADNGQNDEQLRSIFSRSKTMERHFHHLRKFADDRHSELKKLYSSQDKEKIKTWRPYIGILPEKIRRDFQEHEHHKKRLGQVHSVYNDLLKFLRIEHARRVEAESRSQHLASQIKRQTAALKKVEKERKQSGLSSLMDGESNIARADVRSLSPAASGTYTPRMDMYRQYSSEEVEEGGPSVCQGSANNGMLKLCRNDTPGREKRKNTPSPHQTVTKQCRQDVSLKHPLSRESPDPGVPLSSSDLVSLNNRREFEELERALVEEGKSRGFGDADLYSEKTTVGREETCWEYRHVHLDFLKPEQTRSASSSAGQGLETLKLQSLTNLAVSKRTASPSRSEGAIFEGRLSHTLADVDRSQVLFSTEHGQSEAHPLKTRTESNYCKRDTSQSLNSFRPVQSTRSEKQLSQTTQRNHTYQAKDELPHRDLQISNLRSDSAITSFEEESWEDAAQNTLDEMCENVAMKENQARMGGIHPDGCTKTEQKIKDDLPLNSEAIAKKENQRIGNFGVGVQAQDGHIVQFKAMDSRLPDLQRRILLVENGFVSQRIQEQVKQKRWLFALQVYLFLVAFTWNTLWSGSEQLPT